MNSLPDLIQKCPPTPTRAQAPHSPQRRRGWGNGWPIPRAGWWRWWWWWRWWRWPWWTPSSRGRRGWWPRTSCSWRGWWWRAPSARVWGSPWSWWGWSTSQRNRGQWTRSTLVTPHSRGPGGLVPSSGWWWGWWKWLLAPHLLPYSFQPALVLNEVIDKFGGLSIGELGLTDSCPGEQAPQVRVQIVHVKSILGIPPHVADMFESAGCANISLADLFLP